MLRIALLLTPSPAAGLHFVQIATFIIVWIMVFFCRSGMMLNTAFAAAIVPETQMWNPSCWQKWMAAKPFLPSSVR